MDSSLSSGDKTLDPTILARERDSLRVAGTMPELRELSLRYGTGPISVDRIKCLASVAKVKAIDLELASRVPLDRDGVQALSEIKNLRRLKFTRISPDAYPLFRDLSVRAMSTSGSVVEPTLLSAMASIPTLTEFPHLRVSPESLKVLTRRNSIETLKIGPPKGGVKQSSRVYEDIILANPGLRHLSLNGIELSESLRLAIATCSKLESLKLSRVKVTGSEDFSGNFPILKELHLSAKNAGVGNGTLRIRCPAVTNVKIGERWHWATIDLLRNCPKVEQLTLGNQSVLFGGETHFDGKFVTLLAGMPKLWDLNVSSLQLTPDDIPLLAKQSKLVRLDIKGNFTAADLLPLRDCGMLHSLGIRSTELSPSDAERLSEVFRNRNARIRHELTLAERQKRTKTRRVNNDGWKSRWSRAWSRQARATDYFDDPKIVALCEAIDRQDKAQVKKLLMDGLDADSRGKYGVTPLMWCMPITDTGVFELLLKNGADPNAECHAKFSGAPIIEGDSVTGLVASFCKANVLRMVLDNRGDPNWSNALERACLASAVGVAGFSTEERVAKVRLLLDRGADPNTKSRGYGSVFLQAVRQARLECALVLLAAGADPTPNGANAGSDLQPCHYLAGLEGRPELTLADQERVLLLTEKLKRRGAWRPNAKAEFAEYQRLMRQRRFDAASAYARSLQK